MNGEVVNVVEKVLGGFITVRSRDSVIYLMPVSIKIVDVSYFVAATWPTEFRSMYLTGLTGIKFSRQ
jgi:hypothetical protein